ncbi:MAG: GvpL/GvpF family gas vesicle protein [Candidatus Korobacteraceae bacterium]|jgi:gas vesicle protein GvpL/GvpF
MSCVLYCVVREGSRQGPEAPLGVQSRPICLVSDSGLSAVFSALEQSASPPDVGTVLAYEKVVEYYFEQATIVPMRYGCWLHGPAEVVDLLREHGAEYDALLQQLEGFAEMGVQVLSSLPAAAGTAGPQPALPNHHGDATGAAYLSSRKRHYRSSDRSAGQQNEVVDSLCGALAGSFARRKVEPPAAAPRLLSVYFLVPRIQVARFRDLVREYRTTADAKILLSGPWPPYNFVDFPIAPSIY